MPVHVREFELVFEIRDGPQATHDGGGPDHMRVGHAQTLIDLDPDVGDVGERIARERATLIGGEYVVLRRVLITGVNRDDQLVKNARRASRHIDMPIRNRIE